MKPLLAAILLLMLYGLAFAQDRKQEDEVRKTFAQFIAAFDHLDWDRFTSFFSDEATMFQPRKFIRRADNKTEIEAQFREIFPMLRGGQTKTPFTDLQARDLRVQMLGDKAALLTFHLDDRPGMLSRHTFVFQHVKPVGRLSTSTRRNFHLTLPPRSS